MNRDVRFIVARKLHLAFILTHNDRLLLNPHQPLTCAGCRSRIPTSGQMAIGPSCRISRESDGYGSGCSSGGSRPASGSGSGPDPHSVPCVEFSGLGPNTTSGVVAGGGMCQVCGGSANVAYSSANGSQLISCDTSASAGGLGGRGARDTATGESLLLPVGEASALLGRPHRHSVHSVGASSLTRFGAIGQSGGNHTACELATIRFNPLADLNEENTIYECVAYYSFTNSFHEKIQCTHFIYYTNQTMESGRLEEAVVQVRCQFMQLVLYVKYIFSIKCKNKISFCKFFF